MQEDLYSYYASIFQNNTFPLAFLDKDALDANIQSIADRAQPKQIRIASKSVRCVEALRYILQTNPSVFCGLMAFRAEEAIALAQQGFDDILIGYPIVNLKELEALGRAIADGKRITLMIDCPAHIKILTSVAERLGVVLPVCIDVDMSVDFPGLHFGVWRSPLRKVEDIVALGRLLKASPCLRLEGLMGYEAQIAGLGDQMPGQGIKNSIVRLLQKLSKPKIAQRRKAAVEKLQQMGFELRFVNAGGTGSLEQSAKEPWVSEVTAGSGFFQSHLFDNYRHFKHQAAAGFALEITRIPKPGVYTCFGGGYIASGAIGPEKQPLPWLPRGTRLIPQEGAGEVQSPLLYDGSVQLKIGDPVFFRHAKAGELCEHFEHLVVISNGVVVGKWETYRGTRGLIG